MSDQWSYNWLADDGPAFGAPGLAPRWTSSLKDAVLTAYSASSRVWFTVSHGTLNEIYYPTIDRPQTRDMELLFTDGETFFHEEKRDLTYDFHHVDPDAPAVRLIGRDPQKRYTVTKEFIADPHHSVVLMHVKVDGDEEVLKRMKCLCAAGAAPEWRRRGQLRAQRARGGEACAAGVEAAVCAGHGRRLRRLYAHVVRIRRRQRRLSRPDDRHEDELVLRGGAGRQHRGDG